ncbi:Hemolysin, contains CBS domains [Quadrisphaera granulorum]|uniref:CBS domain containing-hemolysin-like protein n=1 Tax=Quadrisphaera granulorum TaxID=317664 RepID=A0A316AFF0_9ACTN|nr:hemolysin family protein [Quadrisphaera granulorum]PWJ56473.1 CBS domain containing-hemolysin-like protein [Quadrisphaera granulorum]SZE95107.1 Hemolysin, contains CBS domains [Quadrisphaera granulorum]
MTAVLLLLVGVVVVLVITAGTAYFVAQEFGYMSVDRARLRSRAEKGDAAAQRALDITRRTSFMLSGAQLGITVTGLLVGYTAEPLIGQAVSQLLGVASVPAGVGLAIGTVAGLLLATFVQMLLGELFPKNYAIARPEQTSTALAASTKIYLALFGWIIKVFDASSNALLRLLRIEPVHDVDSTATARDLDHIVTASRESGDLPAELSVLLDRILDFPDRDAEHAMIPRPRTDVVRAETTLDELRELMATGHSRYPVVDDSDAVVGVVHLTDLLSAGAGVRTAAELARSPHLVATSTPLPVALRSLADSREQLACVIDEHGGLAGVLSLEDIAEEVVGELTDEHDDPASASARPLRAIGDVWEVSGQEPLDEVERLVGHDFPHHHDAETLAGLVIHAHGTLPGVGDTVEVELPPDPGSVLDDEPDAPWVLRLAVLALERHVPSRVRVELVGGPAHATTDETTDDTTNETTERSGAQEQEVRA